MIVPRKPIEFIFYQFSLSIIILKVDKLKNLLAATKPTARMVQQKEVIQQQNRLHKQRQEDQRKQILLQKQKHLKSIEDFYDYQIRRKKIKQEEHTEEIPIEIQEIKKRLRALHQPVTLFAQKSLQRYQRLKKLQEFFSKNPNFDMKCYDEEYQQKIKEQQYFNELDTKYRERLIEPRLGDNSQNIEVKKSMIKQEGESVGFDQMCDQVYLWVFKMLKEWGQVLDQKYNTQEIKEQHKDSFSRYYETEEDMKSFGHVLKHRGGDKDMIKSVYYIANCCLIRQYIMANDRYIDLSIGNAPWPLGVAMLSITVRRNTPKVAHVLNDELTRKWMQSIKRLISVSQQIFPSKEDYKKVGYSVKGVI